MTITVRVSVRPQTIIHFTLSCSKKDVACLKDAQLIFVIIHTFVCKIWLVTRPDGVEKRDKV